MRSSLRYGLGAAVVLGALAGSTAAFGLPWDIDMVDSQGFKAYERKMEPLPPGVVSQPNAISPKVYQPVYSVASPETAALRSPLDDSPATIEQGRVMYETYCTPCHGDGVALGPLSLPGRVPAIPELGGPKGRMARLTDGWVYMTIRHGSLSKIMPAYGYMMTREEQWAIVHYLRTIDNGAYRPPEPPPAPEGTPSPDGAIP